MGGVMQVTSLLPALGHTGGRTFVEIEGSGFRLPEAPPSTGIAPAPVRSVRVWFGSVEATEIGVAGTDLLWCKTPVHDPGTVDITVENMAELPAQLSSGTGPFALSGGDTLTLLVNGIEQTLTLLVGDIAAPGAVTVVELAAALNRLAGVRAVVVTGRVRLRTDLRGPTARLDITGGTAAAVVGFPLTAVTGSDELEGIEEERVVLLQAFEFVRPDITAPSQPTLALRQLMVELGRQIVDNVHFATNTDYDEETGDLLNTAYLARLPALVLAGLELHDSQGAPVLGRQIVEGLNGRLVEKSPPDIVDMTMALIAVASTGPEALNMYAIIRRFFRKNPTIAVPTGTGSETRPHDLEWKMAAPAGITVTSDNSNIVTMTGSVAIRRVQIVDMPIQSTVLPDEHRQDQPHEATAGATWPAETIEVDIVPKA